MFMVCFHFFFYYFQIKKRTLAYAKLGPIWKSILLVHENETIPAFFIYFINLIIFTFNFFCLGIMIIALGGYVVNVIGNVKKVNILILIGRVTTLGSTSLILIIDVATTYWGFKTCN